MIQTLFCFLVPLLGAFKITVVGEVGLSEPVLIIYLLCSAERVRKIFATPVARTILTLGMLWLLSQVATDLYRGTPFVDYSRGWAKIAMLMLSYVGCFVLVGFDFRRLVIFAVGVVLAPGLNYLVYGSEFTLYKFIFGAAVSLGSFILIAMARKPRIWLLLVPCAAGVLALLMDARSLAGVTFAATAYYAILSTGWIRPDVAMSRKLFFALVWAGLAYSSVEVYSYLADQGRLSESALEKYEMQMGANDRFSILMGRSEIYYTMPKILESPIVGAGSWAKDIDYVAKRALEQGFDPSYIIQQTGGLIPTHSHFFGAWLEAGICGAIFWGYVLFLLTQVLLSGWLSSVPRWSGVCSFLLVLFAWDIFFSPYGGERRLNNGFYLWVVTFFVLAIRQQKLQSWLAIMPRGVKSGARRPTSSLRVATGVPVR